MARLLGDGAALEQFLVVQPHVSDVAVDGSRVRFAFVGDDAAMSELLARAIQSGLPIVEFARAEADLEDLFLRTTKGRLQ